MVRVYMFIEVYLMLYCIYLENFFFILYKEYDLYLIFYVSMFYSLVLFMYIVYVYI